MQLDTLFTAANSLSFFTWMVLCVAPYHTRVRTVIFGGVVMLLALTYTALFLSTFDMTMANDMATLSGLATLFSSKQAVLLGWIHYLAFDLVAGLYIAQNAKEHQLHKRVLIPFLLATFMAGPLGLFAYVLWRTVRTKQYTF